MKNKFTDEDLMAFADKETKGEKAMDILSVLLQGDDEARDLSARLDVFVDTRNALVNNIIKENKWESYGIGLSFFIVLVLLSKSVQ